MKLKVDHLGIEYATLIKVTVLPEELPSIAIPSETPTTSNPSTGDTTSTAGLVGLGMISLLGVLVLVKRKKEEE
nr:MULTISPECIES: LPXTG cell wall anchor domain-containing protein [unclassified Breznakia]